MDPRFPRSQPRLNKKLILQITLPLILLTIIFSQLLKSNPTKPPSKNQTSTTRRTNSNSNSNSNSGCDIFAGEWVPNPDAPYYTHHTCGVIQDHQNCLKYGRPNTDFLKWKWKPEGCELPVFDPKKFLEIVRGKSMAFIGDSVARNHMQSLVCLLSRVDGSISTKPPPSNHPLTSTTRRTNSNSNSNSNSGCDIFTGEWVPNPDAPYYTHHTCGVIQDHQNCLKYGRPNTDFLKWKWKPEGCELPVFDPKKFLEIVKGKSMAFIGDSVARNHMQSLVCLLSRVETPADVSISKDENLKRWHFRSYNFTVVILWSPYLVRTLENDRNGRTGKTFWGIHLDTADEIWTKEIENFQYVVISAGHWWFRPLIYYEKEMFIGCRYCELDDLWTYSLKYGYQNAFRTTFRAILENKNFKGEVFLRTFAPAHYEGGEWDQGGDCPRTQPYRNKTSEVHLKGRALKLYTYQMEEFKEAQALAEQRGLSLRLIDMTRIMSLRPDGHPGKFGRPANLRDAWPSDCVHWCLPGPIDTWNDFLLEMLS